MSFSHFFSVHLSSICAKIMTIITFILCLFFSQPTESISKHISKDYEFAMHATLQKPDQQIQYAITLVTWRKKEAGILGCATK